MKANDLVEVEIMHGDDKIVLKRSVPQQTQVFAGAPLLGAMPAATASAGGDAVADAAAKDEGLLEIKSPIVGTFYGTASPDSDAFVDVGSKVDDETVVCIIEAMKVMNEIKSEVSGTVTEVLCTSGQAVEYGQVLFKVRPD